MTSPQTVRLADIARINPRRSPGFVHPPNDSPVAFIPMSAVKVDGGGANPILRPCAEVRGGYTFFQDGDILFAKITPCMQNGKHFIVPKTPNGFGFASTEFHVIRPGSEALAEWIFFYLRQPSVLSDAVRHFSGTAGQQRVPVEFLTKLEIPLPSVAEQKRILKPLSANLRRAAKMKTAMQIQAEAIDALPLSILAEIFGRGKASRKWRRVKIKEIAEVNPHRRKSPDCSPDAETTFIPMESVDGEIGAASPLVRPYAEVRSGYTYFQEGDVLFAKMNSSLRNRKHFIARKTLGGFGFASTEFHVLRPGVEVLAEWLHFYLRQSSVALQAESHFRGTAQQRVPSDFVGNLEIPLPPLSDQRIIARTLKAKMRIVAKLQSASRAQLDAVRALPGAWLRGAFSPR